MIYQMNVGRLKPDNWQYDSEEGGRNIGEAIHIYHLFLHVFESAVERISVTPLKTSPPFLASDNFVVTISFRNGSVGVLQYTSLGSSSFPKESFVVHSGGITISSSNYNVTEVAGGEAFKTSLPEKGTARY